MAAYRKSGNGWRAEVFKSGVRESRSFPTKREAQEWATQREIDLAARKSGKINRWTLAEVLGRYMTDISPTRAGEKWEVLRLKAVCRDPVSNIVMQDISPADLADWRDKRLKTVKPSSCLREINLLKAVWKQALRGEWAYTDADPWKEVSKPADSRAREVIFTDAQVDKIVGALGYTGGQPASKRQQTAVALLLSLETAMRAGEIIRLTWGNVHLDRRIVHLPNTKNGDARDVPLSKKAVQLIESMRGLDETRVFTISSALLDVYYRQGRAFAQIEGPTFHDARATAITRLSSKLELLELARMVGHRDPRSLIRYYRKTATDIAAKLD
ncbi:site-specific integrase [Alcaligenaceae bacterium]|nr:site-specific integrase [Alcaligenaceae bacterium]